MIGFLLALLFQAVSPAASISGTVLDEAAVYRTPLFHARVELAGKRGGPIAVRTDLDGRFEFPDLPPGKYRVTVTSDGFLRKTANIAIAAGQTRSDLVFAMQTAPTIIGRVRDQFNLPISNVRVEAMRAIYGPRGDRSVVAVESALTDDRGEFHLYWLDPGDYYIRASSPASSTSKRDDPSGVTLVPTYYPGFREPQFAKKISLRVGLRLDAFDFVLQKQTNPARISGRIFNEATGNGVATQIYLSPAGETANSQQYSGRSTVTHMPPGHDDGYYEVDGMPEGTYILTARSVSADGLLPVTQKVTLSSPARATPAGPGLELNLMMSPGSPVTGQVVSESGEMLDLRPARVALESVDPDLPSSQLASTNVQGDAQGQFTIPGVPQGDYAIRMLGLPGDAYVKSAVSGDSDIHAKALRIDFASPPPIRIVIASDGGRLDGVVLDKTGQPFSEAQVALVPDASRQSSPDQYRAALSDDDGRFTLRGIPPGEYRLFAWQYVEPNAYMDQIYMEGYAQLGTAVSIQPSSSGTVTVPLIPLN